MCCSLCHSRKKMSRRVFGKRLLTMPTLIDTDYNVIYNRPHVVGGLYRHEDILTRGSNRRRRVQREFRPRHKRIGEKEVSLRGIYGGFGGRAQSEMTERYVTPFWEQLGRRGRKQLLHERSDVRNELRGFRDICMRVCMYIACPRVFDIDWQGEAVRETGRT